MNCRALLLSLTVLLAWSVRAAAYEPPPPPGPSQPYDAKLPDGITLKITSSGLGFIGDQLEGGLQQSALRTTISEALEGQYFEIILPIFGGNLRLTIPCGAGNQYAADQYFDNNYLAYRPWCPYVRGAAVRGDQSSLPPLEGNDRGFRYQRVAADVSTYPVAGLNLPKPNSLFAALYLLENGGLKAQLDMVPEHALFKVNVPVLTPGPGGTFAVDYACFNLLGDGAGCDSAFVATLEADLITGGELKPYFLENTLYVLVTDFATRIGALKILSPLTQNTALLGTLDACIAAGVPGISDGCADQKEQVDLLYDTLEQALGDAALQFFERELNQALSDVLQDGINQLMFDRAKDGTPDPVLRLDALAEGLSEAAGVPLGFNFTAEYKASATNPSEAFFVMDGGLYAGAFSSCVSVGEMPAFRYTGLEADGNVGHDPPRLPDAIPGFGIPYQIGASISDDFINQAVYNMWAAGLLCAVVSPHDPGLPKDIADLLTTDSFAPFVRWLPELAPKAPVLIQVTPRRAPYVTFGDVGDGSLFRLTLPELLLDVFVEMGASDRRPVRVFGMSTAVTIAVDVRAVNFDKAPLIDLSVAFESTSAVAFNDLHPETNAELERIIAPVLDAMAPSVADFVGGIEIPLLSDCFGGVRQRDLVMRTSGHDPATGVDNYLDLYMNFSGLLDFNKIITECVLALGEVTGAPGEVIVRHELGLVAANPPRIDAAALGIDTGRPYRWRLDGGFWWPAKAGAMPPRSMLDGAHRIDIEQDGVISRAAFRLDSAPPTVRFAQTGDRVRIEIVDIGDVQTSIDGAAARGGTVFERRLAPGRHTVRVVSTDAAGHETVVAKTFTVQERSGCASAAGAPWWLAGLVAGWAFARRRAA